MSPRADVTERRERLGDMMLPGGDRSWLDLACEAAKDGGVTADDVLGDDRRASKVRARHDFWARLRALRYSYPEIAEAIGVDHSTVQQALKKLRARGDSSAHEPVGFAGMGLGAGI